MVEGFPAERIRNHLDEHADAVVWLDLDDPDHADLGIVTEEFDLHPLAVEDATLDHQRPKLDRYPTHLFVNVYAVAVERDLELRVAELSAFITPRALITIRKSAFDIDRIIAHWDAPGSPVSCGVGSSCTAGSARSSTGSTARRRRSTTSPTTWKTRCSTPADGPRSAAAASPCVARWVGCAG